MSVKVAVRVRPFNERELKASQPRCCVEMSGPTTTLLEALGGEPRHFTFDYSFWSHDQFVLRPDGAAVPEDEASQYADQTHVYDALGKQVLDNAWAGYHCCLFAYGQTGAGKTFTVNGILERVADDLIKRQKGNQLKEDGTSNIKMTASFF